MTYFCRSDKGEMAAALQKTYSTHTTFRSCRVNLRVQTGTFPIPETTETSK